MSEITSTKKIKSVKSPFLKRKFIFIILAVVIIIAAIFTVNYYLKSKATKQTSTQTQRTAQAFKGSIKVSVSGSGPIKSNQTVDITSTVSSTVTNVFKKDGDRVKKGDVIVELESSSQQDKIDSIQSQIDDLESTQQDILDSIKDLNILAPISGYITNVNLNVGDKVTKGMNVFTIIDESSLKTTLQFSSTAFGKIKVGQKAIVNIPSVSQSIDGHISYIGNRTYTTDNGGEVFDVEITVKNPGALKEGMNANAEVNVNQKTFTSISDGTLEYVNKQIVKAKTDGDVIALNARNNQFVNKGSLIIKLSNDDLEKQRKQNQSKIDDLLNQKKEAMDGLKEYKITAPFDGVVTNISVKNGDDIKPSQTICTIFDDKNLVFDVDIDELDIEKIKIGQEVNVTLDAISSTQENPLKGVVKAIAIEGNTQNGVTTYPVTISINDNNNIKIGMNANAEIIVNEKQDALLIPIEAIRKMGNRYFVFVKSNNSGSQNSSDSNFSSWQGNGNFQRRSWSNNNDNNQNSNSSNNDSNTNNRGTSGQWSSNSQYSSSANSSSNRTNRRQLLSSLGDYYKGAVLRPIEVGINNDQYIEVISGLNEGDVVILPPLATNSTTQTTQQGMGFGIMGGFGGGNPSGEFRRQSSGYNFGGSNTRNNSSNQSSSGNR
ncbi:efflux RND transporter periplasmic adaptor subunit [Caldicellulosiruptoraceae bacterium PP1]